MHQVEHALRLGYLKPGDQVPKVRDVVAALAINTVASGSRASGGTGGGAEAGVA